MSLDEELWNWADRVWEVRCMYGGTKESLLSTTITMVAKKNTCPLSTQLCYFPDEVCAVCCIWPSPYEPASSSSSTTGLAHCSSEAIRLEAPLNSPLLRRPQSAAHPLFDSSKRIKANQAGHADPDMDLLCLVEQSLRHALAWVSPSFQQRNIA
jgi:hypothetical protein